MTVQRTKFPRPVSPRKGAVLHHIIEPIGGMNTSVPPQNLRPGETPYCENFVVENRELTSRSRLTDYGDLTFSSEATGNEERVALIAQAAGADGTQWEIAVSADSHGRGSLRSDGTTIWTSDDTNLGTYLASTSELSFFDFDFFYEPLDKQNAIVATIGGGQPMYKLLEVGNSEWSALGDFSSQESTAHFIRSFDNRLVLFNTDNATDEPTQKRVRWSVRGDPVDFSSVGAGFEDLLNMKGQGTGIHVEEDKLILFSNEEVWRGTPRRDAYAFDFSPIDISIGNPYPRSAAVTNIGTIWLGKDFKFYRLQNNVIRPFSPDIRKYLKDNAIDMEDCWARFDTLNNRYEFYFRTQTATYRWEQGPTEAFYLNTDDVRQDSTNPLQDKGAWMLQKFGSGSNLIPLTCAHKDLFGGAKPPGLSRGFVYLMNDTYKGTSDTGVRFKLEWQSHGIHGSRDPSAHEAISEMYVDYSLDSVENAGSALSVAVLTSTDLGKSFTSQDDLACFGLDKDTAFLPLTPIAAKYAMFKLSCPIDQTRYGNQDRQAALKIQNFHLTLRPYTGRRRF